MISFLRSLLLLLIATPSILSAIQLLQYGSGFSLRTTDSLHYFTVNPGGANAGMTSDTQSETNNIFQLLATDGTNPGGTISYGEHLSIQLPANKLWVTLNPLANDAYIRNNAPQPLKWENLFFVSANGLGVQGTIDWGDHILLGHIDNNGDTCYVYLDSTNQTATTTDYNNATPMIIESANFTPYTQENSGTPFNYRDYFHIKCGPDASLKFNVHASAGNAGYLVDLTDSSTATIFDVVSPTNFSDTSQVVYGEPFLFGLVPSTGPLTMNPAPGRIRTNALPSGSFEPGINPYAAWEVMYFIPVNGRNGDLVYYGDQVYVARNGLIFGDFITEYITVDLTDPSMAVITTTTHFADATPLTISNKTTP